MWWNDTYTIVQTVLDDQVTKCQSHPATYAKIKVTKASKLSVPIPKQSAISKRALTFQSKKLNLNSQVFSHFHIFRRAGENIRGSRKWVWKYAVWNPQTEKPGWRNQASRAQYHYEEAQDQAVEVCTFGSDGFYRHKDKSMKLKKRNSAILNSVKRKKVRWAGDDLDLYFE